MMYRILLLLPACLLALPLTATAQGAGAWTTMLRVRTFADMLATRDTVWCATGEGGLLRYRRAADTYDVVRRTPNGLASNRLTSLARDARGRLWVGTLSNGVSRLSADGSRWDAVNVLDGLPIDSVSVLEAQGDTVWIGAGPGIALWNGDEISGALPDGNTISYDTTFTGAPITGIAVLGDTIWVSSRRGVGFARLSTGLTDWRRVSAGMPQLDVVALASDGANLLALSAGFPYRWNGAQWVQVGYPIPVFNSTWTLIDDAGVVMAVTLNGTFTYGASGFTEIPGSPAASAVGQVEVTIDSNGVITAADAGGLLLQPIPVPAVDRTLGAGPTWTRRPPPPGPPGNNINSVMVYGSLVYVTTFEEGVGRWDGSEWRIWEPGVCQAGCDTTFLESRFAFGTLADKQGRKWMSFWSACIQQFDDQSSPPIFQRKFEGQNLHTFGKSAAVDSSGRVWIGLDTNNSTVTPIALDLYDSSGVFIRNFNPGTQPGTSGSLVHTLTVSRNRRLWVGYDDRGVDFVVLNDPFDPATLTFVPLLSTTGLEVRGIAAHGDSLWMLTPSELRRYSATANTSAQPLQVISLTGAGGSAQFTTQPLEVGPDGSVWAGTLNGVYRFRPGVPVSTPDRYTTSNSPLAHNEVRTIDVDPLTGVAWIATAAGLSRFDPGYVPPSPPPLPELDITVYPNPALLHGGGMQLRLSGQGSSYRGAIYDIAGRRVREFTVATNGGVFWDGRNESGVLVDPGIYFVRAEAGGRSAVARIALVQ